MKMAMSIKKIISIMISLKILKSELVNPETEFFINIKAEALSHNWQKVDYKLFENMKNPVFDCKIIEIFSGGVTPKETSNPADQSSPAAEQGSRVTSVLMAALSLILRVPEPSAGKHTDDILVSPNSISQPSSRTRPPPPQGLGSTRCRDHWR